MADDDGMVADQQTSQEGGEMEYVALMQTTGPQLSYSGSFQETERDSDAAPSTLSTRTMIASAHSDGPPLYGPSRNLDYDWLQTWSNVRRCLTEYDRNFPLRIQPDTVFVHILGYHVEGDMRTSGVCPNWLLTSSRPVCLLADWFQEITFQLYWEYSRAFPLQEEVYQNTPSILVIQELISGQIPIVIQIRRTGRIQHFVYLAFRFERVSAMLNWVEQQTRIDRPYEAFLEGRRVFGHQDVPLRPGTVLQLRLRSSLELFQPHASTTWTDSVRTGDTGDTWEASPFLEEMVVPVPEEGQDEAAHTLEPVRLLQNLRSDHDPEREQDFSL